MAIVKVFINSHLHEPISEILDASRVQDLGRDSNNNRNVAVHLSDSNIVHYLLRHNSDRIYVENNVGKTCWKLRGF